MNIKAKPILIVGGGIAGMTAATDAAEVGYEVVLVEKEPYLGGRVLQMYRYFPKMCPPTCGFEINVRRIRQNPRINVHTMTTVEEVTGKAGNFRATLKTKPGYITSNQQFDSSIIEKISSERANPFNYEMDTTKALYRPHDMAYPPGFVLDKNILTETDEKMLKELIPSDSIDLKMTEEEIELDIGAVIVATGWKPYDANNLDNLAYGKADNVITNVMMERLAAHNGPTGGKLARPSDGKKPKNIAFVQCAGSRDENHLPYCSAVCCMGSLKQARYIREMNEDAKVTIFYIDVRTIGREENFYFDLLADENVNFVKGKVAEISEEEGTGNLILDVEDTVNRETLHKGFDLVVLATGVVPNGSSVNFPFELKYDDYGFIDGSTDIEGVYAAGCTKRPCDVSRTVKDSTAAVLKAIQCLKRGGA